MVYFENIESSVVLIPRHNEVIADKIAIRSYDGCLIGEFPLSLDSAFYYSTTLPILKCPVGEYVYCVGEEKGLIQIGMVIPSNKNNLVIYES